jgi:diguanylate cyclase (GGDEF)-like protein
LDDLYEKERRLFQQAKDLLDSGQDADWRREFENLAVAYEELLNSTIKVLRVADRSSTRLIHVQSKLKADNEALELTSTIDTLTGLLNRRKGEEILLAEMAHYRRTGISCSVILVDLDHFKIINDTWGHNKGDEVLIQFATVLGNRLRATDFGARWGGDEFLVILPNTSGIQALLVAEALRQAVESARFSVSPVTISLGVAELEPGMDIATWFAAADLNLYQAKNQGRNRIGGPVLPS